MREIRNLKKWVEDYEELRIKKEDLEVLIEFHKTGEVSEEEVEKIKKLRFTFRIRFEWSIFLKAI